MRSDPFKTETLSPYCKIPKGNLRSLTPCFQQGCATEADGERCTLLANLFPPSFSAWEECIGACWYFFLHFSLRFLLGSFFVCSSPTKRWVECLCRALSSPLRYGLFGLRRAEAPGVEGTCLARVAFVAGSLGPDCSPDIAINKWRRGRTREEPNIASHDAGLSLNRDVRRRDLYPPSHLTMLVLYASCSLSYTRFRSLLRYVVEVEKEDYIVIKPSNPLMLIPKRL